LQFVLGYPSFEHRSPGLLAQQKSMQSSVNINIGCHMAFYGGITTDSKSSPNVDPFAMNELRTGGHVKQDMKCPAALLLC